MMPSPALTASSPSRAFPVGGDDDADSLHAGEERDDYVISCLQELSDPSISEEYKALMHARLDAYRTAQRVKVISTLASAVAAAPVASLGLAPRARRPQHHKLNHSHTSSAQPSAAAVAAAAAHQQQSYGVGGDAHAHTHAHAHAHGSVLQPSIILPPPLRALLPSPASLTHSLALTPRVPVATLATASASGGNFNSTGTLSAAGAAAAAQGGFVLNEFSQQHHNQLQQQGHVFGDSDSFSYDSTAHGPHNSTHGLSHLTPLPPSQYHLLTPSASSSSSSSASAGAGANPAHSPHLGGLSGPALLRSNSGGSGNTPVAATPANNGGDLLAILHDKRSLSRSSSRLSSRTDIMGSDSPLLLSRYESASAAAAAANNNSSTTAATATASAAAAAVAAAAAAAATGTGAPGSGSGVVGVGAGSGAGGHHLHPPRPNSVNRMHRGHSPSSHPQHGHGHGRGNSSTLSSSASTSAIAVAAAASPLLTATPPGSGLLMFASLGAPGAAGTPTVATGVLTPAREAAMWAALAGGSASASAAAAAVAEADLPLTVAAARARRLLPTKHAIRESSSLTSTATASPSNAASSALSGTPTATAMLPSGGAVSRGGGGGGGGGSLSAPPPGFVNPAAPVAVDDIISESTFADKTRFAAALREMSLREAHSAARAQLVRALEATARTQTAALTAARRRAAADGDGALVTSVASLAAPAAARAEANAAAASRAAARQRLPGTGPGASTVFATAAAGRAEATGASLADSGLAAANPRGSASAGANGSDPAAATARALVTRQLAAVLHAHAAEKATQQQQQQQQQQGGQSGRAPHGRAAAAGAVTGGSMAAALRELPSSVFADIYSQAFHRRSSNGVNGAAAQDAPRGSESYNTFPGASHTQPPHGYSYGHIGSGAASAGCDGGRVWLHDAPARHPVPFATTKRVESLQDMKSRVAVDLAPLRGVYLPSQCAAPRGGARGWCDPPGASGSLSDAQLKVALEVLIDPSPQARATWGAMNGSKTGGLAGGTTAAAAKAVERPTWQ